MPVFCLIVLLIILVFYISKRESLYEINNSQINISKIAKVSNYKVFSVKTKKSLEKILKEIPNLQGPILIHIHLNQGIKKSSRVNISPEKIKTRFMNAIN